MTSVAEPYSGTDEHVERVPESLTGRLRRPFHLQSRPFTMQLRTRQW